MEWSPRPGGTTRCVLANAILQQTNAILPPALLCASCRHSLCYVRALHGVPVACVSVHARPYFDGWNWTCGPSRCRRVLQIAVYSGIPEHAQEKERADAATTAREAYEASALARGLITQADIEKSRCGPRLQFGTPAAVATP